MLKWPPLWLPAMRNRPRRFSFGHSAPYYTGVVNGPWSRRYTPAQLRAALVGGAALFGLILLTVVF